MALKLVLDTLDGLEEGQKALYVEKDGKFHLDVDGLEDTSGLKSALQKERDRARDFEKKLAGLKDLDPEEYARLKKEAEERATKQMEEKGEFDKLREKWRADQEKKEAEFKAKLAEKDALLRKLHLDREVRDAALKAGVLPDDVEDVMHLTSPRFRMEEDGGITVLGKDGQPSPDDLSAFFAKTYKEERPKFYAGTGATGGGAQPPKGGQHGGTPQTILASDTKAFGANLEDIAAGKIKVQRQQ
ncbi:hypothetical protein [Solidesulfovibrio alcoholivorans]|uniref:hypothetical protein n=1 Tax=Solidesulfovibrio alcoholivorans TaxID=81406 RepID=UPI000497DA5F|nr:hypothetical protein [Solidesulfovibrio alcoholivorans]